MPFSLFPSLCRNFGSLEGYDNEWMNEKKGQNDLLLLLLVFTIRFVLFLFNYYGVAATVITKKKNNNFFLSLHFIKYIFFVR